MSGPGLSARMLTILRKAPADWTRWPMKQWGFPSHSFNPTIVALRKRGLIDVAVVPLRWRVTSAGSAALTAQGAAT